MTAQPAPSTDPLDSARAWIDEMAAGEEIVEAARANRDRAIHDIAASIGMSPREIGAALGLSTSCIRWVLKAPRPAEKSRASRA